MHKKLLNNVYNFVNMSIDLQPDRLKNHYIIFCFYSLFYTMVV